MKNISFQSAAQLLTALFLGFVITIAHANTQNYQYETLYTIQLGVYQDVDVNNFSDVRGLGFIYADETAQENAYNVFISNFTSRKKAENGLIYVQSKGYQNAFLSERPLSSGEEVYVVQMGSQKAGDYIDWEDYARGGQIYVIIEDYDLKITSAPFTTYEKAQAKQEILLSLGYKGAFIKKSNTVAMHKINKFNTIKEIDFTPMAVSVDKDANNEGVDNVNNAPSEYDVIAYTPTIDEFESKGPSKISKEIRFSVKSFQNFLLSQNAYVSGIDGIYGKGTASAIALLENNNPQIQKYKTLASENAKSIDDNYDFNTLEQAILLINSNPKEAYAKLDTENTPVAKAYQAYILFNEDKDENLNSINQLMNKAIEEAYESFDGNAPFDYTATYSYTELKQLILHTRYIQAAIKEEPITPCWLFVKHKKEAYDAFYEADEKGIESFNIQHCNGFLTWDNIILLKTISTDLNPDEGKYTEDQKKKERDYNSIRNRLYLIPRALNTEQEESIVNWNDRLWASMDLKMAEDEFFAKFAIPFKTAYHKAWIELEDYYMEKGFKKYQANALALTILQTIVDVDIESYIKTEQ